MQYYFKLLTDLLAQNPALKVLVITLYIHLSIRNILCKFYIKNYSFNFHIILADNNLYKQMIIKPVF